MRTIQIKYFTDKTDRLAYIGGKSDWIDLRAAEDITLKVGEFKLIPLDAVMKLPKGYEVHIMPRSSTFKDLGTIQINHQGVTDETCCGDGDQWHFPAFAMRDTVIKINNCICQFRIMEHQLALQFNGVETLAGQDRGGTENTGIQ